MKALVLASFGRHWVVRDASGDSVAAVSRGRKGDVAVGDWVDLSGLGSGQAVIENLHARRNELRRTDARRTKLIAANVDQLGVVISATPPFSEELLLRVLVAAAAEGIDAAVIFNKVDLLTSDDPVRQRLELYRSLGYPVFECSALNDPQGTRASLIPWLQDRTTVLLGQSGMGKSTLINLLVPHAEQRTREISTVLSSGKHTTTFTRLFELPDECSTALIDSPGFQSFGLEHLSVYEKMHAMPEFAPLLGHCRFNNCTHRDEPGCAIRQAVKDGLIDARRHELFVRLVDESEAISRSAPMRR